MGTATIARPATRAGSGGLAALPAFAAALSLSAAIAHFGVIEPHWRMWPLHGLFFVICGVAQTLLAVLLAWRPRQWVAFAGIVGNLAVIAAYVYSRTNGLPIGPHEGVPEEPGVYDMVTTGGELVLVFALVAMLGPRARKVGMNLLFVVGLALWAARATGFRL